MTGSQFHGGAENITRSQLEARTVSFLLMAVAVPTLGIDFLEMFIQDVSPQRKALLGPRRARRPLQQPTWAFLQQIKRRV